MLTTENHKWFKVVGIKISFEHVDSWAKSLLFRTHHLWNSTTKLILDYSVYKQCKMFTKISKNKTLWKYENSILLIMPNYTFHKFIYFFQILFLSGLAFVIGLERTFRFFFQYHKIKGSTAFFGGIFVVLFGYPLIGMIIEAYGFIVLFSGFFPVAINFLRRIPVIGTILNLPGISSVSFLRMIL